MSNTHYCTSGHVGVDLNNVTSSANRALAIGQMFALGTRVSGSNQSQWAFVYATAGIAQYALVGIQASGTAAELTSTLARAQTAIMGGLGIAQQTFVAGDYGWVATEGSALTVLTTAASTAGERLYTTATAGRVSTAVATAADAGVTGLRITVTTGATASSSPAIASNLVLTYPSNLTT